MSSIDIEISNYEFILQFQINAGDTTAKLDNLYNKYKSIAIPAKYRKVNGYFYRGMILNPKDSKEFKTNKILKLNKRTISSWSTDKRRAKAFAGGANGILIKAKDSNVDVFLNLSHPDFDFTPYVEEKEVIVRGNGLDVITDKDIER